MSAAARHLPGREPGLPPALGRAVVVDERAELHARLTHRPHRRVRGAADPTLRAHRQQRLIARSVWGCSWQFGRDQPRSARVNIVRVGRRAELLVTLSFDEFDMLSILTIATSSTHCAAEPALTLHSRRIIVATAA